MSRVAIGIHMGPHGGGGGEGGSLPIQGYGKNVTGGAGYPTYVVTDPRPINAVGTFERYVNYLHYTSNCNYVFAPGITSFSTAGGREIFSNVTIDGLANGNNGVAFDNSEIYKTGFGIYAPGNVIIRGINFRGNHYLEPHGECDLINVVGRTGGGSPLLLDGLLIDRCTFSQASDGALDMTLGEITNVTVQACLFCDNHLSSLIKYGVTTNMSIHHNVYTYNSERNPQARGWQTLDFVNNVLVLNGDYSGYPEWTARYTNGYDNYATRFWSSSVSNMISERGNVVANVRGCAYLGTHATFDVISDPGASVAGIYWDPRGKGANNNFYDPPWLFRNGWQPYTGASITYSQATESPKETPNDIPAEYAITRHAITELKDLLSWIGCPRRIGDDQMHLNKVYDSLVYAETQE